MVANEELKGNLSMFLYILVTALSTIVINNSTKIFSPLLAAFYTFSFCIIIYNALSTAIFRKLKLILKHFRSILILNLTTSICWIFGFLSLSFIPPELYLFMYLGAMPIASSIILRSQMIKATLLCVALIFLVFTYKADYLLIGAMLAFVGGASGTVYSIFSKKIVDDFTTLEILSMRFYLTVVVTGLLCVHYNLFTTLSLTSYLNFFELSLIAVIVPLILFQSGIKYLPITKALYFLPFTPLVCYLIQMPSHPFNKSQFIIIILLISIMMLREKSCKQ